MKTLLFHNENMNKKEWYEKTTNGLTVNEVAVKAGLSSATAWRQCRDDLNFSMENVIKIARAFDADPVDGLIAFGYLKESERNMSAMTASLRNATDEQLIEEMARRLAEYRATHDGAEDSIFDKPIHLTDEEVKEANKADLRGEVDSGRFLFDTAASHDDNKRIESVEPPDAA